MDDEIIKRLDRIIELLAGASKPRSRFVEMLELAAAVITVLSAISIIDVIKSWL
jgi:hypothetical protein